MLFGAKDGHPLSNETRRRARSVTTALLIAVVIVCSAANGYSAVSAATSPSITAKVESTAIALQGKDFVPNSSVLAVAAFANIDSHAYTTNATQTGTLQLSIPIPTGFSGKVKLTAYTRRSKTAPPSSTTTPLTTASLTTASPRTTSPTTAPTKPNSAATKNCATKPSLCGYPDAANTGAQTSGLRNIDANSKGSGWHVDTRYGVVIIDTDGTVFENYSLNEMNVEVQASNVTVRNNKIVISGESWGIGVRTPPEQPAPIKNVVLQNNTICGANANDNRLMVGIKDIYGNAQNTKVIANNIYNVSTGVQMEAGVIAGNYIHDMGFKEGDHVNGTTSNGGKDPLTIDHNTVLNQLSQTDAVSLFQDFDVQANRTITNNLLAGGGYALYGGVGNKGESSNIRVENNRFSKIFFPTSGYYGPVAYQPSAGSNGNTFTNNYWDDSLAPVN